MIWSEYSIGRAIALQTLQRKCLVLVPNCNHTGYECDLLAIEPGGRIIDVEIKISRADLKADAGKGKWWTQFASRYDAATKRYVDSKPEKREWPPRVWKHYYCMPEDVWTEGLESCLPTPKSGVILLRAGQRREPPVVARVHRRATPNRESKPVTVETILNLARLASLRLWDSYQEIERCKSAAAASISASAATPTITG